MSKPEPPKSLLGDPVETPRIYLRGTTYWADIRLADGTRKRITTGTTDLGAAERKAEALAVEYGAPVRATSIQLHQALDDCYRNHWHGTKSATIVYRVCNAIIRDIGYLKLADVNYERLETYCKGLLLDGLKPATVNRRMSTIGTALTRCVKKGWLASRPLFPHYAENNIKERYLTREEEAALIEKSEQYAERDRILGNTDYVLTRDMLILLLDSGMRFSEAFKFTIENGHANLKHGETKSKQGRMIPLTKRALAAAEALLANHSYHRIKLLPDKKPWDFVAHRFSIITREAGCPDVTLHTLRHTCASRLVQKGVPIYTVSKWLGHSSVKITERYAKLAPNTMADALKALEENEENS